jgi:hypothetical protein
LSWAICQKVSPDLMVCVQSCATLPAASKPAVFVNVGVSDLTVAVRAVCDHAKLACGSTHKRCWNCKHHGQCVLYIAETAGVQLVPPGLLISPCSRTAGCLLRHNISNSP